MTKKNKGLSLGIFAFLFFIAGGFAFCGCSKSGDVSYAKSEQEFDTQFQTQKVVYVDDLDFEESTMLEINRSIKFVGKKDKSKIKNLHINIWASNVSGERIEIGFENVIFDGGFDKSAFDLTQELSFENILGNRNKLHCITASVGHYNLNINNCEFLNYASEYGSVVFVNNDVESPEDKNICINNCKFYGNVCKRGTLDIFHDKANVKINNCEFFENYGATATGFNVSNGKLLADNCVVRDNNFCKFDIEEVSGQEAGGGVHAGACDGKILNTKILNNKSVFGGGLSVVTTNVGNDGLVIAGCTIKGNTAIKNGGGVIIHSKQGQTVSFISCEISFNKAPSSANVCSIPMGGWSKKNKSGNVNFFFCRIAMNGNGVGDDKGIETDLGFYGKTDNENQRANLQVKGCIIIDKTTLTANDGDFNYIASHAQAETEGVIFANFADEQLCLQDNRKIRTIVPASEYSLWDKEFAGATKFMRIGSSFNLKEENTVAVFVLAFSVLGFALFSFAVLFASKKKLALLKSVQTCDGLFEIENVADENSFKLQNKKVANKEIVSSFNEDEIKQIALNWELVKTLSKKEKEVFLLRLLGKKRKDIAKAQYVSENTIKKQLVKIYAKLEVESGRELMQTAKKFLNE